jgi:ACS family D-galactonate transporter-like MFS transporter
VMGLGFLVWTLATAATGLVPGFALLFVVRLMLGVGESVIFPASSKILAENLPEDGRGFANGVICAGMKSGPALGTFAGGLLMSHYGWRWTFLTIGAVSLVWMPAWMRWGARNNRQNRSAEACGPSTSDILHQPVFWGVTLAQFCSNSVHYFTAIWMPLYLMNELRMPMQRMARIAGLYFLGEATAALVTGWWADILIRRGGTASMVRKSIMVLGFGIAAAALVCCAIFGPRGALWCLPFMALGCGMGASGVFAFPQTLAGPLAAGRWVGLENGMANLAGILGPALTGFVVDRTGSFAAPLLVTAGMASASAWAYVFLSGPLEQVHWPSADAHAVVNASNPA